MSPFDPFDLPAGYFGPFGDNEVELVSDRKPDPVKFRGAVHEDVIGASTNLAALSGNVKRRDGNQEEFGLVMIRRAANLADGAVYIAVRRDGRQEIEEVAYFGVDTIIFHKAIQAPNLGRVSRFYSDHGKYCFNVQDDDPTGPKITVYDTKGTTDESQWVAGWQLYIPRL